MFDAPIQSVPDVQLGLLLMLSSEILFALLECRMMSETGDTAASIITGVYSRKDYLLFVCSDAISGLPE